MNTLLKEKRYKKFKTELAICKIGGLFLALYNNKEVAKLIIKKLTNEDNLEEFFQAPLYMDETKVPFPILFEQTFEQMGNKNNIYHVLGIEENLSSAKAKEFLGYLQYARERFKAKPYSIVFWITPEFEKELFYQAPDFHHWVFSTYDFTDEELKNITFSENNKLIDIKKIDKYLEKVIWQYQNWEIVKHNNESFLIEPMERVDLYHYYIQSYCINEYGQEQLLDDLSDKFINNTKQSFLILLGDFGTGKSSFSIHYFIEMARRYLNHKSKRIPIFISLKDYRGKFNIEGFMLKEFYEKFKIKINLSIFYQLALEGKFIFFVDGFDEMASLTDKEITIRNLKELTKLSFENDLFMTKSQDENYKINKVFLTSRTHYFLTEYQEKEILKADRTILYRNYATKSNYKLTRIKLKEFNDDQIREYIQKHTNDVEKTYQYLKIIKDTYNLKELSTRPLLLEMIINTIDKFKEQTNINTSDLYRTYTNIWIDRDDWRSQMTSQGKRSFMWEIAVKMFEIGGDFSLHYSQLDKPKNEHLKSNFQVSDQDYYKYESTTCTFLNRDSNGNYKFIHKSFMEYFVAESFYWNWRCYNTRTPQYSSFSNGIKFFFKSIITIHKNELDSLDLSCFHLSRINLSHCSLRQTNFRNADLRGANLSGANLRNADLRDANLSGANLRDADLRDADLRDANLSGANLRDANLRDANLSGADLSNTDLKNFNLSDSNLMNANLNGIDLRGINLRNANLNGANLRNANLNYADLRNTNLRNANLKNANLEETDLNEADLKNATLYGSNFINAYLINVKNITPDQLQWTLYWDRAKWIIDQQANREYIKKMKLRIDKIRASCKNKLA